MPLRRTLCVPVALTLAFASAEPEPMSAQNARITVLRGTINRDVTLRASRTNVLDGIVVVASGSTLRVRAGATVLAGSGAALIVERGAKLIAEGQSDRPVVFTSAQPEAERRRGDWGGVILNGGAPVDASEAEVVPVDGSGRFGGPLADDSSGELRYVRIEYAGFPRFGADRQPAISLRGVGRGTVVDRVQAINSDGDGIAVVGGALDARYVVSVGCAAVGFRASRGWGGSAQYVVSLVRGDMPGHVDAGVDVRDCRAAVANATVVGGGIGLRIGGSTGRIENVIVARCAGAGVHSTDSTTTAAVATGLLAIDGLLLYDNRNGDNLDASLREALQVSGATVFEGSPALTNPFDEAVPSFVPRPESPALSGLFEPARSPVLEPTAFAGAFDAGDAPAWTDGWASFRIPPVPRYLAHSSTSPEALARNFLDALAVNDIPALKRTRITKDEFTWYVWPELPASRLPNVTSDFAWSQATLNSLSGLGGLLSQYSSRRFELVGIRFAGGTKDYPSYRVHYDSRITVRDEAGDEYELKLFGSMLEMDGRFKLFSHVID